MMNNYLALSQHVSLGCLGLSDHFSTNYTVGRKLNGLLGYYLS